MKTIYPIGRPSIYAILGLLAFTAVSCGSYQNSSYYDSDGIYGDDKRRSEAVSNTQSTNQYKEYFSTLKEDEIFTDVDNYSSIPDSSSRAQVYDSHPGWGSESENVTVNLYTNAWGFNYWPNYWYGPGWGWGFNSWYGPSWGYGWNNWGGFGWGAGFGWGGGYGWGGYPFYGNGWYNGYHGNSYSYHPGRRGSSYSPGVRNSNGRSYYTGTRTSMQSSNGVRTQPGTRTFSTRGNGVRTQSTGTPRSDYNTPRTNSNVRQNSSPSRSYSPASSGGGRSSGGSYGGGGRSGGGRR